MEGHWSWEDQKNGRSDAVNVSVKSGRKSTWRCTGAELKKKKKKDEFM